MTAVISIGGPQNSVKRGAWLTSASLTLGATVGPLLFTPNEDADGAATTSIIDTGNAPYFGGNILWTHSTAETLSMVAVRDNDRAFAFSAPPAQIPVSTDGTLVIYPLLGTWTKTNWSTTTSPTSSATVKNLSFEIETRSYRYWRLYFYANSAVGSLVAYLAGGGS